MPLTLAMALEMSNEPVVQKIIYNMAQYSNLLAILPFEISSSIKVKAARFDGTSAPTVNWVDLGVTPPQTIGKFETVESSVMLVRDQISIDTVLQRDTNIIGNPTGTQIDMFIQSLCRDFNDKFINNDSVSGNSSSIEGLRGRLNKRALYGIPADLDVDMDGLDLRSSVAITLQQANQFMRSLDDLLAAMTPGPTYEGVVIFANDAVINAIAHVIRLLGAGAGFAMTKDAFDRHMYNYNGATIINPGLKFPLHSLSRVMTNTENASGTSTVSGNLSSLFAVRFGEDGLLPWINKPFDEAIIPVGLAPDGVIDKITFDLGFGIVQTNQLAVGRLRNFRVR